MKVVNKKAYFNYFVEEEFLAGLILKGSEVKSLRKMDFNFVDSYIYFKDGELWIKNLHISKYKDATLQNHEELRERKILLKKNEIRKISKVYGEPGITIIPLEILTVRNLIKAKIGICKGKKSYNKKETIKKRDIEREEGLKF